MATTAFRSSPIAAENRLQTYSSVVAGGRDPKHRFILDHDTALRVAMRSLSNWQDRIERCGEGEIPPKACRTLLGSARHCLPPQRAPSESLKCFHLSDR